MMPRVHDWPERLAAFLEERRARPFVWGENDCCLFACDAVLAMTGTDLAVGFRGSYSDALSAARTMRKLSGGGVIELAEKFALDHAIEEILPAFAQRGDVVQLALNGGDTLAILGMDGLRAVGVAEDGLRHIELSAAQRAWRIA